MSDGGIVEMEAEPDECRIGGHLQHAEDLASNPSRREQDNFLLALICWVVDHAGDHTDDMGERCNGTGYSRHPVPPIGPLRCQDTNGPVEHRYSSFSFWMPRSPLLKRTS